MGKEDIDRIVQALYRVAQALEQISEAQRSMTRDGALSPDDTGKASTAGAQPAGRRDPKKAMAQGISSAVKEGFKTLSGDIVNTMRAEFRTLGGGIAEFEYKRPLQQLDQYARDLALAGEKPTTEKLQDFYDRSVQLGSIQREAQQAAYRVGGRTPDALIDMYEGSARQFDDWFRDSKNWADKKYAESRNVRLHEE